MLRLSHWESPVSLEDYLNTTSIRDNRQFTTISVPFLQLWRRKFPYPLSSVEDLERCVANGYVYEVRVKGKWAGVIAVWREGDYGMRGYCIEEYILASGFRKDSVQQCGGA